MKKTTINYWVDVAIGISFVFSAISGLVFLFPGDLATGILGISYLVWNSLHTWSSLALIFGVGAHLVLHWKWMVSMTKKIFSPAGRRKAPKAVPERAHGESFKVAFAPPPQADPEPGRADAWSTSMDRRTFLAAAGTATVAGLFLGALAALGTDPAEANDTGSAETNSTQQQGSVACPKGLAYDPYPGKCRHYVDTTGDGFCDYSIPD